MFERNEMVAEGTALADKPPTYVEIRVKGQLEGEMWTRWFEGVSIAPETGGETVLRGPVRDQAALYGMLSRLRDLALPLVSVRVFRGGGDPPWAGRRMNLSPRVNWTLVAVYVLMGGGLAALTVFLTSDAGIDTALALAMMFAALGGIGGAFRRLDGGRGWIAPITLAWIGAASSMTVYIAVSGLISVALILSLLALAVGGGLLYLFVQREGTPRRLKEVPDGVEYPYDEGYPVDEPRV
jgi:hypothetical protein